MKAGKDIGAVSQEQLLSPKRPQPLRSSNAKELEILDLVKKGDEEAFERLYRIYYPRLTRFLSNLVRRPPIVEEVLNDTMMVVWLRPDSFHGGSKLSTWIFAIAYRKAMKALKRQDEPIEGDDRTDEASEDHSPEDNAADDRRHTLLRSAINDLSPSHRAVVDLTYYHELDYNEIAAILDCPVGTVKTRMFHARRQLRRQIGGGLEDWF